MSTGYRFGLIAVVTLAGSLGFAQAQLDSLFMPVKTDSLGTSILFDRPDDLRDLSVGVQPIYGELSGTGNSAGFGLDVRYRAWKRIEASVQFRKSWSARFHDQARDDARRNSNTGNGLVPILFFETGLVLKVASRRIHDSIPVPLRPKEWSNASSSARKNGMRQASSFPAEIRNKWVPSQRFTSWGLRGGFIYWQTVLDVTRALDRQGKLNAEIQLPEEFTDDQGFVRPFRAFSSMNTTAFYAGMQFSSIRNLAVAFDDYEVVSRDAGFTLYADLLFTARQTIADVRFDGNRLALDALVRNGMGFRAGFDVRHDRDIGYAFGAEFGVRPGPAQGCQYMVLKVSLPVFSRYVGRKPHWHRRASAGS